MNLLINRNRAILIFATLILFAVVILFDVDFALPLVLLSASGNSSCGNGMGGAGAGGGFGNCGGSTGGGSTGGGSTPFLCTWDGSKYNLENDILFGKPVSLFPTKAMGIHSYEKGGVIGDYYKIQNSVKAKDKALLFQIKEIEPEESYIDYLSLTKIVHDESGYLVTGSDFRNHLVFEKKSLETGEGISALSIKNIAGQSITTKLAQPFSVDSKTRLETGESIIITAKVSNPERSLYLLLGSQYRDWTAGEIKELDETNKFAFIQTKVRELLAERNPKSFLRKSASVVSMVVVLSMMWAVGQVQTLRSSDENSSGDKLAASFGTKKAYADVPSTGGGGGSNGGGGGKSLNVEFKGMNGIYQMIDIVQPRYLQSNLEAVLVPPAAIAEDGSVDLRITATKRHDVTNVVLVSPSKLLSSESTEMKVSKATLQRTGEDFTKSLNSRMSGEYMHTIPADVVDIEFGPVDFSENIEGKTEVYLISAHGFYTPLTDEVRAGLGNWVSRLDSDSQTTLKKMYSLNDYHSSDRKPVLN